MFFEEKTLLRSTVLTDRCPRRTAPHATPDQLRCAARTYSYTYYTILTCVHILLFSLYDHAHTVSHHRTHRSSSYLPHAYHSPYSNVCCQRRRHEQMQMSMQKEAHGMAALRRSSVHAPHGRSRAVVRPGCIKRMWRQDAQDSERIAATRPLRSSSAWSTSLFTATYLAVSISMPGPKKPHPFASSSSTIGSS